MDKFYTLPGGEARIAFEIRAGDRLFDSVHDLHILVAAMALSISVLTNDNLHTTESGAILNCHSQPFAFQIGIRGPIENLVVGQAPEFMLIRVLDRNDTHMTGQTPFHDDGVERRLFRHIAATTFLLFFERYNNWLTRTYGDGDKWPPVLDFARVVRNAAAHGSANFRSPSARSVSWRGLSYGPSNNQARVFGKDMGVGDTLALMFDVDEALNAMGAPVL